MAQQLLAAGPDPLPSDPGCCGSCLGQRLHWAQRRASMSLKHLLASALYLPVLGVVLLASAYWCSPRVEKERIMFTEPATCCRNPVFHC